MSYKVGFLTREEAKELLLSAKDKKGFTWSQLGKAMGLSPVYTAMLVYGYGQATVERVPGLIESSISLNFKPFSVRTIFTPP